MVMKLAILSFVLWTVLMTVLGVGFVSEPPSPSVSPFLRLALLCRKNPTLTKDNRSGVRMPGLRKGSRTSVNARRTPKPATPKTRNARCIATKTIVTVSTRGATRDSKYAIASRESSPEVMSSPRPMRCGSSFHMTILTVPNQATDRGVLSVKESMLPKLRRVLVIAAPNPQADELVNNLRSAPALAGAEILICAGGVEALQLLRQSAVEVRRYRSGHAFS